MKMYALFTDKVTRRYTFLSIVMIALSAVIAIILIPADGMTETKGQLYRYTFGDRTCELTPVTTPSLPEKIPDYAELDPDTNMHITGTAEVIDVKSYTLEISGNVRKPLKLSYDDLRCLPRVSSRPTLVCPGFFEDTASWSGAAVKDVLALANLREDATHVKLVSADGYSTLISIKEAVADGNYLAYEWEGEPIPVLHGFPVRAVFPDLKGNKWVKWLVLIEVQ